MRDGDFSFWFPNSRLGTRSSETPFPDHRATASTRNRVLRRCVPEKSSGTSCWSDFLVPKLPFGNPLQRNSVSRPARQSQRETEFRGDSYPNRVRVRVAGAISWFPNSRLGTRSSEALFRVPRDSLNAKQRFAKNGANWHNWSSGADWSHYRRKSLQT